MAALAAATLAATANADTFGSGANQFSIDFVNIGYAGNAAKVVDYGPEPDFPDNYDAPSAGYGAVNYDYGIGKYEITIDQFTKADAASGGQIGNGNEDLWDSGVAMPPPYGNANFGVNAPASLIQLHEAAKFANWLTSGNAGIGVYSFTGNTLTGINRLYRNANDMAYVLPTDDEWYKAAYYKPVDDGSYSLYSSGLDTPPVAGAGGWNYKPDLPHAFQPAWETGSGAEEQNGTYDMMGNVWEWMETSTTNDKFIVRGGSSYVDDLYLDSETYRPSLASSFEQANIGFRVVAIPEPGSLAMVALLGSGIWGIRRFFRV